MLIANYLRRGIVRFVKIVLVIVIVWGILPSMKVARNKFSKVLDGRKHPIRGLWQRNGRYYAQITMTDPQTGRPKVTKKSLVAETVPAAVKEVSELKRTRENGWLLKVNRDITFAEAADLYARHSISAGKRSSTIKNDSFKINSINKHFGPMRISRITPAMFAGYKSNRLSDGASSSTVRNDFVLIRNILRHAIDHGYLAKMPIGAEVKIKVANRDHNLVSEADIDLLCKTFEENFENGKFHVQLVRFLQHSGCREQEAFQLKWRFIDMQDRRIHIGADFPTKSGKSRWLDINSKLHDLLVEMESDRVPVSDWLFPSVQNPEKRTKNVRSSFNAARKIAGLTNFSGYHALRHYFISRCLMSGIDILAVAGWVGHQDKGLTIARTYAHLCQNHARAQAKLY